MSAGPPCLRRHGDVQVRGPPGVGELAGARLPPDRGPRQVDRAAREEDRGAAGAAYTASKHGVIGLTCSVAWAYAKEGIRCNAILPGPTMTGIATNTSFDPTGAARLAPVLALGEHIARPEQMADAALFLASDAASFVNGAIVPVDGGWSAA
ncbi:SDR family oxidoreductase [Streptosporangium roseum]|uniref:SDR family oxidoreductase n=1 Tax=Streptosporangium roseum TaxID=2001 RepID=UPI00331EC63D